MNSKTPKLLSDESEIILPALGLSIFLWSLLFVWQGLDFTDMGFSLSTYQQFYSAPENNIYGLINWLTAFLGHWIGETIGGTVLSYKLSASLILALTGVIAYQGLQLVFGRSWELASFVFVAFLFSTKSNVNWIHYNNLTALFYTLGAVSLFYGLNRERQSWILIAGLVLGANMFIRFPNLLGLGMVSAVALHSLLQRWHWQRTLSWSLVFVVGYLLGIVLIIALIQHHGHTDLYLQSLQGIFSKAVDDNSSHSGSMLIRLFLRDHAYAFILSGLVIGVALLMLCLITNRPIWLRSVMVLISALVLGLAFNIIESWKWAVPGLIYIGLIWIAKKEWRVRPQLVVFLFIALAVLVLAPLGSNNGIRNSVHGQWLALPLVLIWLWQDGVNASLPFIQSPIARRLAATTLIVTLVGYSLVSSWFYSYRDSNDRFELIHTIEHPLLVGTHTTAERAQVVSQLLHAIPTWVQTGDTLLVYPDSPTIHFLTQTQSWLNNPWPILYGETGIQNLIDEKLVQSTPLPVVIRSIGITRNRTWPLKSLRNESPDREAAWAALDQFIQTQGYVIVWSNDFFEILVPKQQ